MLYEVMRVNAIFPALKPRAPPNKKKGHEKSAFPTSQSAKVAANFEHATDIEHALARYIRTDSYTTRSSLRLALFAARRVEL